MASVAIFEKAQPSFGANLASRGHHVVYRTNESNRCPGCGRAQWYVGRVTAECGFCGTAVALAEVHVGATGRANDTEATQAKPQRRTAQEASLAERREHERVQTAGRTLQLMIEGSPHSFALENLSAGGAMGKDPLGLMPGDELQVRFEGGILVPAVVKWRDGELVGLAFTSPLLLDAPASHQHRA